jgi:threonine synthase
VVSRWYSALSYLECAQCGVRHDGTQVRGLCLCGSPMLARYDLERVAAQVDRAEIALRPPDLWRYHELLPVSSAQRVVSLGEGMTPLLAMRRLGKALGVPRLLMKEESLLPTGTFKARGASVGVSRAAEPAPGSSTRTQCAETPQQSHLREQRRLLIERA